MSSEVPTYLLLTWGITYIQCRRIFNRYAGDLLGDKPSTIQAGCLFRSHYQSLDTFN